MGNEIEFMRSFEGILSLVKIRDGEEKEKTIQHFVYT